MGHVACIDIGTVTSRLALAEVVDGRVVSLDKTSTITDLGEGLAATGQLSDAAIARVLAAVDAYLAKARSASPVPALCCTLTSAARDATNSDVLVDALAAREVPAQVIPGEVEGRLTLLGVCQDFPGALVLVADNGGGSTELALGRLADGVLDARAVRSVDVGCRRITERCLPGDGPATPEQLSAAHAFARRPFAATVADLGLKDCGAERLVVTGGTATSLIAIRDGLVPYDSCRVHLHELALSQVNELEARLAVRNVEERTKIAGLQPQRAPVILGGVVAIAELMRATGFDRLTVSESDLLFGLSITTDAAASGASSPVGWTPEIR